MREPLINSQGMICPRCLERQNLLSYKFLQFPQHFESEMVQLYKCTSCKFVFGPNSAIIYKTNIKNAQ